MLHSVSVVNSIAVQLGLYLPCSLNRFFSSTSAALFSNSQNMKKQRAPFLFIYF